MKQETGLLSLPVWRIEKLSCVSSTNTLLREKAEKGEPEGAVLLARSQTAGRGRGAHSFYSPAETGLYMSLLLRPALSVRDSVLLTTCAAAAAALAIEDCTGRETQIKWVNDIFSDGKKVCGILTEGAVSPDSDRLLYAVVGVGVNLLPPAEGFPPEIADSAGAVFPQDTDAEAARKALAERFLHRFSAFYPNLCQKPFWEDYQKRSLVLGQSITILERSGERRTAFALALDDAFGLVVREEDGDIHTIFSGEVSVRPRN